MQVLFDEIRKKVTILWQCNKFCKFSEVSCLFACDLQYETSQQKREEQIRKMAQDKEPSKMAASANSAGHFRRETWIHPDGGRRIHRTALLEPICADSEEEELQNMDSIEVKTDNEWNNN